MLELCYSIALDNPSPNAHDCEELETTRTGIIATSNIVTYYGNGYRIHTVVTWAIG